MTVTTRNEKRLTDKNGAAVHGFMGEMSNLGLPLMGERIVNMLSSGVWQDWKDGLGRVELLPGEFDYFLSMCGVERKDVKGLNPDVLCAMDAHMDERRVTRPGEEPNGYRRRYLDVAQAVGYRQGTAPWVVTDREKTEVRTDGTVDQLDRDTLPAEPLGARIRRLRDTGDGEQPSRKRPRAEQLATKVAALPADEYRTFQRLVKQEREDRRRVPRCEVCGERLDTRRRYCDATCRKRASQARKRAS